MALDQYSTLSDVEKRLAEVETQLLLLHEEKKRLEGLKNDFELERILSGSKSYNNNNNNRNGLRLNEATTAQSFDYEIYKAANEYWQITEFRQHQLDIIRATLTNNDVICIMATGAGKSLCFQLPAVMNTGTTVVISPLLSLIYDQVEDLNSKGIAAKYLTGSTPKETAKVHYQLSRSCLKLGTHSNTQWKVRNEN